MALVDAREGKWRKLANGVGSQYPSHYLGTWYPALLPLMRAPPLPVVDWTDAPVDLNGLVRFAERRNLVSARVPSHFKRSLTPQTPLLSMPNKLQKDSYVRQVRYCILALLQGYTCVALGVFHSACYNKFTVLWTVMLCAAIRTCRACGWRKRSRLKRYYLTVRSHEVTWQKVKITVAKTIKTSGIAALK
jgi:hypothetical protein